MEEAEIGQRSGWAVDRGGVARLDVAVVARYLVASSGLALGGCDPE
jgi:hypothetical protein